MASQPVSRREIGGLFWSLPLVCSSVVCTPRRCESISIIVADLFETNIIHIMTNGDIADLLRSVAAVYSLGGLNRFQILAYEGAADGIERATSDLEDLWERGGKEPLKAVPGVGDHIANYLDELFKTGKVEHFEKLLQDYPEGMFTLLKIPGIGPKTALKLSEMGVTDLKDLKYKIEKGLLEKKLSRKLIEKLRVGVEEFYKRSDRMLLPFAQAIADEVLEYLRESKEVKRAEALGSLRRGVATIGDIDIALSTENPKGALAHIQNLPSLKQILEKGENTITLLLKNGVRVDIMVQPPHRFGALLQHFTGSKHHNIRLRSLANEKGYSLSEYGLKDLEKNTGIEVKTEEELYRWLGMQTPPPELREDQGEIEAALKKTLPKLVESKEIKGDLHSHTTWSDGLNSVKEMAESGLKLGYQYLALTDHSYPNLDYSKRIKQIEQYNYSSNGIRVIIGLEVNITADSKLQIDEELLEKHEFILASIHTSFRQDKETITNRLKFALEHPLVNGIAHPTGRLLLQRSGYEADWSSIFETCLKKDKFLEINSFPDRLDLPDPLAREAIRAGVKLVVNTDAHRVDHLNLMRYGIVVARRGWAESKNILNTLSLDEFVKAANVRLKRGC